MLAGGLGRPAGLDIGNYVGPTLLSATDDMIIAQEEIFGPVLAVITHDDEDDAVELRRQSRINPRARAAGEFPGPPVRVAATDRGSLPVSGALMPHRPMGVAGLRRGIGNSAGHATPLVRRQLRLRRGPTR